MPEWTKRPIIIEYWPDQVDCVIGIDENGTSDIKRIIKLVANTQTVPHDERNFTLTGVILDQSTYTQLILHINDLKSTYWPPIGTADYLAKTKKVCFHSREIRKRLFPFNQIDHTAFTADLSQMIEKIPTHILAVSVNKEELCKRSRAPQHPYHLAVNFILERYCEQLNKRNQRGIMILESRGAKEDRFVLRNIANVVEFGTERYTREHFRNFSGAYFNPKWWAADNHQSSFVILELADLISYPIHKYVRGGECESSKDRAFRVIEKKLLELKIIP